MTAHIFAYIFLIMLAITTLLRIQLAQRQIRHVQIHRKQVPEDFSAIISLPDHQKAADYTVVKTRLAIINTLADTGLLLIFTLGGGLNLLWSLSASIFNQPILQGLALFAGFTIISSIVSLPFAIYSTFNIETRFGFNKMTVKLFINDMLKGAVLSAVIGLPLLALILWLMQAMGELWWLWVWAVWAIFSMLMLVIFPTVIAPMFNKFQPLEDGELKNRIESLLQRTGFKSKGVFIMDGSKRSRHGNAYFTGFGAAKRIVFFDTLIKQLTPDEIEAVLAHELGHFRLKHITKRIAVTFTTTLIFLFVLGLLIDASWFYLGLGVYTPSTAMALILFFTVTSVFTFPFSPLTSLMSRKHEYEADGFAAEHTHAQDLITALTKLYRDNASTLTPDPLYSAFYASHPSAAERIGHLKKLEKHD